MSNQFWCGWIKKFLPNLSKRQKWFLKSRNLQLNEIVSIVENMQQRLKWVLGRAVKMFPDKLGVVRTASVKTPSFYTSFSSCLHVTFCTDLFDL